MFQSIQGSQPNQTAGPNASETSTCYSLNVSKLRSFTDLIANKSIGGNASEKMKTFFSPESAGESAGESARESGELPGAFMVISPDLTKQDCIILEKENRSASASGNIGKTRDVIFKHKSARDAYVKYIKESISNKMSQSNDEIQRALDKLLKNCSSDNVDFGNYRKLYFQGIYAQVKTVTDLRTVYPIEKWIEEVKETGLLDKIKDLRILSPDSATPYDVIVSYPRFQSYTRAAAPVFAGVGLPEPAEAKSVAKHLKIAGFNDIQVSGYRGSFCHFEAQGDVPDGLKKKHVRYIGDQGKSCIRRRDAKIVFSSSSDDLQKQDREAEVPISTGSASGSSSE